MSNNSNETPNLQREPGYTDTASAIEIPKTRSRRGFAAMDPERQRTIASLGGRAAHTQGVAHQWTSEEAREAGRKGGQNSHNSRNQQNRDIA